MAAQAPERSRQQLSAEFSELDDRFAAVVRPHTPEQLVWRPGSGKAWSVAECMEHVALTNSSYLAAMRTAISGNRAAVGSFGELLTTAGWPSAFFL